MSVNALEGVYNPRVFGDYRSYEFNRLPHSVRLRLIAATRGDDPEHRVLNEKTNTPPGVRWGLLVSGLLALFVVIIRASSGSSANFNPYPALGIVALGLAIFAPKLIKTVLVHEMAKDLRRGIGIVLVLLLVPTFLGSEAGFHDWSQIWMYLLAATPLALGVGLSFRGLLLRREWPLVAGNYELDQGYIEFLGGQVRVTPKRPGGLSELLRDAEQQGESALRWRPVPKLVGTGGTVAIVLVCLALLSVGGRAAHNGLTEKNLYADAREADTLEGWNAYIEAGGRKAEQARREHIPRVAFEAAKKQARLQSSAEPLEKFLAEHPGSAHEQDARALLRKLQNR